MFLISDKVDKTDTKYDLMKEDKADLLKEEKGDPMKEESGIEFPKMSKFHKWNIFAIILIGMLFCVSIWMMHTPILYPLRQTTTANIEDHVVQITTDAVNRTRSILSAVRQKTAAISQTNKNTVAVYVADIRNILKNRTNYSVQKLDEMIVRKSEEISKELISFNYVISEAGNGIVDAFQRKLKYAGEDAVSKIDSFQNAEKQLDELVKCAEKETSAMLDDIDEMYTFYSRYLGEVVQKKAQNITDRASLMLNGQRADNCDFTFLRRVNACFDISSQNDLITQQLRTAANSLVSLQNTRDTVDLLQTFFERGDDQHLKRVFDDARCALKNYEETNSQFLYSLLEDDSNFLGSLITNASFADVVGTKKFVLRSFTTALRSVPKSVNQTTSDFLVVKAKHLDEIRENAERALKHVGDVVKEKIALVDLDAAREAYVKKADFADLKLFVDERLANVSRVINPIFEERKAVITTLLKWNVQFCIENQLSYIYSLSVDNYLPSDTCPLSTDYQRYATMTAYEEGQKEKAAVDDIIDTARYFADEMTIGPQIGPFDRSADQREVSRPIEGKSDEAETTPTPTPTESQSEKKSDQEPLESEAIERKTDRAPTEKESDKTDQRASTFLWNVMRTVVKAFGIEHPAQGPGRAQPNVDKE